MALLLSAMAERDMAIMVLRSEEISDEEMMAGAGLDTAACCDLRSGRAVPRLGRCVNFAN